MNFAQAVEKINDLIGVRAVCAYVDDIYKVADLIQKQQDIRIIKIKDYIKQPKKSGYQSLHLILEIAIPFQNEDQWVKLELQTSTTSSVIREVRNRLPLSMRNCSNVPL